MTDVRIVILNVAAEHLAATPLPVVTMAQIVDDAGLSLEQVAPLYSSVHTIASVILDHERGSMHAAQERVFEATDDPLERLTLAFRFVGENLATDMLVRAGVRIAYESRDLFPERRLDPFRTWEKFVTTQLVAAESKGLLRAGVDVAGLVWIIVAAGMGTKDLLAFHDTWDEASIRLEATVAAVLDLVRAPPQPEAMP